MTFGRGAAARIALVAAILLPSRDARADPAAAEAAFAEARALIKKERWQEACPKLEASMALDPAVGTLLNLAECLAKTGQTASAWLRYREAASMALQHGQTEREAIARDRARALESSLCRIIILAPKRPDLTLSRDGAVVDANVVGVPTPVDPGTHEIRAEARGETPFLERVEIRPTPGAPCADTTVTIPFAATSPRPLHDAGAHDEAPPRETPTRGWRAIHNLAVIAAGTGVVGLGVGAGFGLSAASAKSDAEPLCTATSCTPEGRALRETAGARADVATVAFVAGGAFLAAGLVLWLVSPSLRDGPKHSLRDSNVVLRF